MNFKPFDGIFPVGSFIQAMIRLVEQGANDLTIQLVIVYQQNPERVLSVYDSTTWRSFRRLIPDDAS